MGVLNFNCIFANKKLFWAEKAYNTKDINLLYIYIDLDTLVIYFTISNMTSWIHFCQKKNRFDILLLYYLFISYFIIVINF